MQLQSKFSLLEKYPWPNELSRQSHFKVEESFINIEVKSSLKTHWRLLSDSSRFNRALKMGPRKETEVSGELIVETKMLGVSQKWIEIPWNWNFGKSIIVDRKYLHGFANYNHSIFYFYENEGKKYIAVYMGFIPSGFIAKLIFKFGLRSVLKNIESLVKKIDEQIPTMSEEKFLAQKSSNHFNRGVLEYRLSKLEKYNVPAPVVSKMREFIMESDDFDATRIKIKKLAAQWGLNVRELLGYFLIACDQKVFSISWDVICPSCHGPRTKSDRLIDLLSFDDCSACQIQFETNFENAVEVIFKINPDIRIIEEVVFCAAQPAKKAHVKMQWEIPANSPFELIINNEPGEYRLRKLNSLQGLNINISETGLNQAQWEVQDIISSSLSVQKDFKLIIFNNSSDSQRVVLETIFKDPDFLTPGELFSLKEFRSLFGNEAIGTGVQLYLGDQVVLFTDIISSTKFYRTVGDKQAYEQIRKHFEVISKIFDEYDGVIIKTIGDAVMATFPNCDNAFLATKKIHETFRLSMDKFKFTLRVSAHVGRVIGVNQNTGVDYFGNTVNLAAKFQAITNEKQLAVSEDFFKNITASLIEDCLVETKMIDVNGIDKQIECRLVTFHE